ncbi:MAG: SRPBCC family protein [Acidimicrobiales bacterium]|nr:SRPBCC family protein [Acidimicrobiales bacterium]
MEIRSEIDIDRPVEQVFAVVADMSRNPEWQTGMVSCSWTTEPPILVGSTYDQVASFMGREILTTFEVTEFDAPSRIRIESIVSTFPLDITRTVEPRGDGSRVVAVVRGEPGGLMKLFAPLMTFQARRSIRADYQRLKELLEG